MRVEEVEFFFPVRGIKDFSEAMTQRGEEVEGEGEQRAVFTMPLVFFVVFFFLEPFLDHPRTD